MFRATRSAPLRALVLAGMACVAALLSNLAASWTRRLAWAGSGAQFPASTPPLRTAPPPEPLAPPPIAQEPVQDRPRGDLPPAPRKTPTPASRPADSREIPLSSPIREISGQEAWEAFQSGAPFLDARRSLEFAEGHIAGAWSTPVWEADLDDRLLAFKAARRPGADDPIVLYCSGWDCRDSHLLAEKLLREGYFHLLIFRDGFPAWVAQGHPTEKGRP